MSYPGYELNEYQREALRTAAKRHKRGTRNMSVLGLGIAGEAGEVADAIKKHVGHGHPLDVDAVVKELGDVLWYVATLADALGWTLAEVAEANVTKLRKRYPDGFSKARSMKRKDGA